MDRTYTPHSAQVLYRMCWQIESWLRLLVYVELRASRVDWDEPLRCAASQWPPTSLASDKKLHHMTTPHSAGISYLTLGQLWNVVSSPNTWPLFAPYFPPQDNAEARIKEVKAIRNRVAHFRCPHPSDVDRLRLFARDMDAGLRKFCSRYTSAKFFANPREDAVATEVANQWGPRGYGVEMDLNNGGWLYAPEPHRRNPRIHASLSLLSHETFRPGSLEGLIYRLELSSHQHIFDIPQFFIQTAHIHEEFIHLILPEDHHHIEVTIPAIHGTQKAADLVFDVLDAGLNSRLGSVAPNRDTLGWPEYVLWPDHLLTLYYDGMKEPLVDLA
jgi:hypothetical protein